MRRFGLFCANAILGTAGAAGLTLLWRRGEMSLDAVLSAFRASGWAGFVVGATVGLGASVGSRPPLPFGKCVVAQALVAVSTAVGGFVGSLFETELSTADRAVRETLARQGIPLGSWVGAAVGTLVGIIQVYRKRREAPER